MGAGDAGQPGEKLAAGEIDLECGSTTNTLSRQEQVSFSLLTFADGGSLLMKIDSGLGSLADMNGRRIGVVPGTTTEGSLQAALGRGGVRAELVKLKDHAEGLVAVMEGRIDAYASDRVILVGLVLGSGNQKSLRLAEEMYSYEPYALMLRRDDAAFGLAVNRALARLYRSEEIYAIYERWLGVLGTPGPLLRSLYFLNGLPEWAPFRDAPARRPRTAPACRAPAPARLRCRSMARWRRWRRGPAASSLR